MNARFLLLAVGVAAATHWGFSGAAGPSVPRVGTIPHVIGAWAGEDVPLDERSYEILETREVLYREYRSGPATAPVDLCVVVSESNRKASHPPEVCFAGAGASVDRLPRESVDLQGRTVAANALLVRQGRRRQAVLYWYLADRTLTTSYAGQQLAVVRRQLRGLRSSAALIRVSTPVADEPVEQAIDRLKEFAGSSLPVVLERLT